MVAKDNRQFAKFTFHYVSIKTISSTESVPETSLFTFHYVSIKTLISVPTLTPSNNLHSTMYLLKHRQLTHC